MRILVSPPGPGKGPLRNGVASGSGLANELPLVVHTQESAGSPDRLSQCKRSIPPRSLAPSRGGGREPRQLEAPHAAQSRQTGSFAQEQAATGDAVGPIHSASAGIEANGATDAPRTSREEHVRRRKA